MLGAPKAHRLWGFFFMSPKDFPFLGFGVGLRHHYSEHFSSARPAKIDWVEAITENYLPWEDGTWVRPIELLEKVRAHTPVALHGVSLSIGAAEPLNESYLWRWKELIERIEPAWVSDHLCWTGSSAHNAHDLLPLPYTKETLNLLVEKVSRVQEYLGRRILLENVSSYVEFAHADYTEWDFLATLVKKADCALLLDVNNVYVSSINHGFDPRTYLEAIPVDRVGQIHLAGHRNKGKYCIDTHDEPVCDAVWELYRWTAGHFGQVSTMIERDDRYPDWNELASEVDRARNLAKPSHATARTKETPATL